MNTYAFSIVQVDYYPEFDGHQNVVQFVHWQLTGSDGDRTASVAGATHIPYDPDSTFEPLDALNADEVIGWVKTELAKNETTDAPEDAQRPHSGGGLTEAAYKAMIDELLARQPQAQPVWV